VEPIRGVLLDLDGVFYVGEDAVPGAADALAALRAADLRTLLLTNTTSRPRTALLEKLDRLGVPAQAEDLLTPAVAAGDWIRAQGAEPVATFFAEATAVDLGAVERLPEAAESGAGAVVLGDLGDRWDFATLNRAFRLLMTPERPPLLALGMTRYWRAPDGLRLDASPFVRALEHAADVEAVVLGKPSSEFFAAALARIGCSAGETLMVGDDVRTDVGGAQAAGLRGALVRTGKFAPSDLEGAVTPDAVLDSLADLPAWLGL
jgi:HAD superfamily hydrolase (TIGR01458 family)